MPYATVQEMEDQLGIDTLRVIACDKKTGLYDPLVVGRELASASSLIDGYIHNFLPLSYIPDALRQANIAIAAQNLRLPRNQGTENSKLLYDNAIKWLVDISKGLAQLPPPVGEPVPQPDVVDPGDPEIYAQPRMWSRQLGRGAF